MGAVEKYGKETFADPVNKKYPIDTPGRAAAKARRMALPDPDEFVALLDPGCEFRAPFP